MTKGTIRLVVSLMASFVLSFFPLDVLDEIWDLIESVSEGFLTYFCITSKSDCSKNISAYISNGTIRLCLTSLSDCSKNISACISICID